MDVNISTYTHISTYLLLFCDHGGVMNIQKVMQHVFMGERGFLGKRAADVITFPTVYTMDENRHAMLLFGMFQRRTEQFEA